MPIDLSIRTEKIIKLIRFTYKYAACAVLN